MNTALIVSTAVIFSALAGTDVPVDHFSTEKTYLALKAVFAGLDERVRRRALHSASGLSGCQWAHQDRGRRHRNVRGAALHEQVVHKQQAVAEDRECQA